MTEEIQFEINDKISHGLSAIRHSKSLNELCDSLNRFYKTIGDINKQWSKEYNVTDFLNTITIPTFGEPPIDKTDIISWDKQSVLFNSGTNSAEWSIIRRDELK